MRSLVHRASSVFDETVSRLAEDYPDSDAARVVPYVLLGLASLLGVVGVLVGLDPVWTVVFLSLVVLGYVSLLLRRRNLAATLWLATLAIVAGLFALGCVRPSERTLLTDLWNLMRFFLGEGPADVGSCTGLDRYRLDVARVLGIFAVFGGALAAALAVWHDRFVIAMLRYRRVAHVLIYPEDSYRDYIDSVIEDTRSRGAVVAVVRPGEEGSLLARRLADKGVVVVPWSLSASVLDCPHAVLNGEDGNGEDGNSNKVPDPGEAAHRDTERLLRSLFVHRTAERSIARVTVLAPSAKEALALGLQCASALAGVLGSEGGAPGAPSGAPVLAEVLVRVDNYWAARQYRRALIGFSEHRVLVDVISRSEVAALELAFHLCARDPLKLVVLGETDLTDALLDQLVRRRAMWAYLKRGWGGGRLPAHDLGDEFYRPFPSRWFLALVGDGAEWTEKRWRDRVRQFADVDGQPLPDVARYPAAADLETGQIVPDDWVAVITAEPSEESMRTAFGLQSIGFSVWVLTDDRGALPPITCDETAPEIGGRLRTFTERAVFGRQPLESMWRRAARLQWEGYGRNEERNDEEREKAWWLPDDDRLSWNKRTELLESVLAENSGGEPVDHELARAIQLMVGGD